MHPFIVVTGNNGVGKSSVVQSLRERFGATTFHYPDAFRRFRVDAALDTAVPPRPRLLYYLAATLELSELVRRELSQRPVICDRYVESPLSLLEAESALSTEELDAMATPYLGMLRIPDRYLVLTASHDVAAERIRHRTGEGTTTRVQGKSVDSPEFYAKRADLLWRWAERTGPAERVDTTDQPLDAVLHDAWKRTVSAVEDT